MTPVNMIAAAAPAGAHPASPGAVPADGATFGAVLDQAMRTTQAAAAPAAAARPDPGTPAARHGPADGEVTATGLGGAAPVSDAEDEPTPSLAEIALPIGALTSFLAAFIALAVQARPAGGAAAEIGAGGDGVSVAAVGLSVAAGGQTGRAEELVALARLVGGESAANDEGGLAALFATLGDETGTEAALEPIGQASAAREATPSGDASLGALVDALVELATRAGASENGRAAVALAALVGVDDGAAGKATPGAAAAAASLQPVAEVARLVAALTRELSAASGHVDASQGSGAGPEGVRPELRTATAQTLVALADAAQAVRVGQVSGRSQVTVQLQPESLGKVTIEVERTGEGAVARIVASTAEAQRAIAGNIEAVRGALAAIGVEVGRVEVSGPRTGAAPPAGAGFDAALDAARRLAGESEPTGSAAGGPDTRGAPATKGTDGEEPAQRAAQPADWAAAATNAGTARTAPVEGAAAAPETPRTGVAQLVRDIADQAGVLLGQGKSQFQLQLRPESLGRLHVRMTLEAGEVTVQMRAESAAAKSAIESNLGQLKQSFHEQGIRVDRFEVVVAQGQLSHEQGHPRRSRGWVDQTRPRSSGPSEDDFAGALAEATRPVDFRA